MDLMQNWFDSTEELDAVTVEDFDKYVEEYLAARAVADEIEAQLTEQNKKVMAMSGKLISFLDKLGKNKHVIPQGTISKVETKKWKPSEGEYRESIIQELKDKGQYDNVTSFNSNKFHSWYESEREINPNFELPGVELATSKYIRFSKSK